MPSGKATEHMADSNQPLNASEKGKCDIDTKLEKDKQKKVQFIPPDGGWGWVIAASAGLSVMSTLCIFQQFSLLFRHRFDNATAVTTIANVCMTMTSVVGLGNGPLYRLLSFRQVALIGGCFCVVGVFMTLFIEQFWLYILAISVIYGIGLGWIMSSGSIAMNTYFKKRRRLATSIQWTLTGMGPIVMPLIIRALYSQYGHTGTVLIFVGIVSHSILFALLFQPVEWHAKKNTDIESNEKIVQPEKDKEEKRSYFGSKTSIYTFNEDDPHTPGYEIIEPVTMLSKANENYSSKTSLNETLDKTDIKRNRSFSSRKSITDEPKSNETLKTIEETKLLSAVEETVEEDKPPTFWQKIVEAFDFDLLKDKVFINIILGVTLTSFNEMNFAILTPQILRDMNYDFSTIASLMSVLGGIDVACRLCVPIIGSWIKWNNRGFFLLGVMLTATGRTILAIDHSPVTMIVVLIVIGIGKAFRTVFNALVIPSHVPLEKLPGATGLQLITNGIFSLTAGPLLGLIRDATSTMVLLHVLNATTFLTFISWSIEMIYVQHKKKNKKPIEK